MSIKCRGWHRNTPGAPGVHVTQLIRELLKPISSESIVVVQHVIVCGSTCSLRKIKQSVNTSLKIRTNQEYISV